MHTKTKERILFHRQKAFSLLLLIFVILLIVQSKTAEEATVTALQSCLHRLIPTLFPFMLLNSLWGQYGSVQPLEKRWKHFFTKILKLPTVAISCTVRSLLFGFPMGFINSLSAYRENRCSRKEAGKMALFSNNAGPSFLIAGVGAGIFNNLSVGILLFVLNWFSSFLILIFWQIKMPTPKKEFIEEKAVRPFSFPEEMKNAVTNMLYICGCVVFSSILVQLGAKSASPLWGDILSAFLEIGTAVTHLGRSPTVFSLFLLGFSVGFGGFSLFLQCTPYIKELKLPIFHYLVYKLLQGIVLGFLFTSSCFLFSFLDIPEII